MSVAVEMNKVDFRKVSATVNSVFRTTTEIITPVKMKLSEFIFRSEVSTSETKMSDVKSDMISFEGTHVMSSAFGVILIPPSRVTSQVLDLS